MLRLMSVPPLAMLAIGVLFGAIGGGLIWLGVEERLGFLVDVGVGFAGGAVACVLIGGTRALWAIFKRSRDLSVRQYRRHRGFLQPVLVATALVFVLLAGLAGHNYVSWAAIERDCELALNTDDRVEAQWALTRARAAMEDPLLLIPSELFDLWGPNRCRSAVERHQLVVDDSAPLGTGEPESDPAAEAGQPGEP